MKGRRREKRLRGKGGGIRYIVRERSASESDKGKKSIQKIKHNIM